MERPTPLGFNDRQIPEAIRMVFTVKPVHFCVYVQSAMETVVKHFSTVSRAPFAEESSVVS